MENMALLTSRPNDGQNKTADWNWIEQHLLHQRNEARGQNEYGGYCGNTNFDTEILASINNSRNFDNFKLQDGKEAHFFVSYSSDDKSRVVPIIENLEKETSIRCILDERDFKPGWEVFRNIKWAMEKSMKLLLFLSKNFLKSNFCKHEMTQAFHVSMETDGNYVIPVLLEECEVPSILRTLTYVDATRCDSGMSARIIEAFHRKRDSVVDRSMETLNRKGDPTAARSIETVNRKSDPAAARSIETINRKGDPATDRSIETINRKGDPAADRSIETVNRTVENGFDIDLVKTETNCCTGFMGEKAVLSYATVQAIQAARIEVPVETLQRAVDILNSLGLMNRWVMIWIFITLSEWALQMALFIAFGQSFFKVDMPSPAVENMLKPPAQLLWGAFVPLIVALALWPYYRHRQNKDLKILSERLFYENTMGTYKQGVFFHVVFRRSLMVHLHTTKYLATHMIGRVEKLLKKTIGPSEIFDTCADAFLEDNLKWLIEDPPEHAPTTRHPVKPGKKCFCQRLDPLLNNDIIMILYEKYSEV